MELITGFIGGILLTPAALIALFIIGVLFEHNGARGWAVFAALVTVAVAFFFFSVPWTTLAMYVAGYAGIGLLWSFWRYKRHVGKVVEEYRNDTNANKERALTALHPKAMIGTITAWIMIWPFSLVESLAGDIINVVQALVTKVFRGVYHRVYESAVSALR